MSHLTTNCCYVATMEKAGEARPKVVVEVGVGALDVVEKGHDGEGVLLIEEEASEAAVGGRVLYIFPPSETNFYTRNYFTA